MVTRPPRAAGLMGKGGDNIVGLEAFDLFAGDVKGAGCVAGQRDLRAQFLWHGVAVGLVLVIHVVAKGMAALVKDHRDMGGSVSGLPNAISGTRSRDE